MSKFKDRADIPNREGFLLTVILRDGTERKTVVNKRQDGSHFLTDITFSEVVGWMPRTK